MLQRLLAAGAPLARLYRRSSSAARRYAAQPARPRPRPPARRVVDAYGMSETWGGVVLDGVAIPGVEVTLARRRRDPRARRRRDARLPPAARRDRRRVHRRRLAAHRRRRRRRRPRSPARRRPPARLRHHRRRQREPDRGRARARRRTRGRRRLRRGRGPTTSGASASSRSSSPTTAIPRPRSHELRAFAAERLSAPALPARGRRRRRDPAQPGRQGAAPAPRRPPAVMRPMLAEAGELPPDDAPPGTWAYEMKWDGVPRCSPSSPVASPSRRASATT